MDAAFDPLDTSVQIVTPENIAFRYYVAGPFRRLPAYLIDLAIRVAALIVIVLALSPFMAIGLGGVWAAAALIWWFVLAWFYGGVFEAYWNGQTPGKRLMKIRVLSVDGQPINGLQAVLRNILRAVDTQPGMTYLVGLVAASTNSRFQRLGDWVSGTMVVVEERGWFHGVVHTSEAGVRELADKIPAGFQVSPSLARALASYVQRRGCFSPPRRMEIARYAGDPLRERFGLPRETNLDHLLCALYQRTFITDGTVDESDSRGLAGESYGSPFRQSEEGTRGGPIVPPIKLADDPPPETDHVPVASAIGEGGLAADHREERTVRPSHENPPREET
jgi:uncharacterized RDD family membrane protein YckC